MSHKQYHHLQSHHLDYDDAPFCGPIEQQQRQHNILDDDSSQREEELVPGNGGDEKEKGSNQLVTICGDAMLGEEPQ